MHRHAGFKQDRSRIEASYQAERIRLPRSTHLNICRIEAVIPLSHRGCTRAAQDGALRESIESKDLTMGNLVLIHYLATPWRLGS